MKTYYVLWTYIANYSERVIEVQAKDAEDAIEKAVGFYLSSSNPKFREKATIYVFDQPPVVTRRGTAQAA